MSNQQQLAASQPTYTLTQEAYACGTNEALQYRAAGVDAQGNAVLVTWDVYDCWQEAADRVRANNGTVHDERLLNDEADACDWDAPVSVELA